VVKNADWLIDLGPLGGDRGGEIVAQGTPEQVALVAASYTGQYLRKVLPAERIAAVKRAAKRNGASGNGAKPATKATRAGASKRVVASNGSAKKPAKARR